LHRVEIENENGIMKLFRKKLHEVKNETGSAPSSPSPAKPLKKVTPVDVLRYR